MYTKVAASDCWKETGKAPVQVRWIDINKGDAENPDYRSRLVAKDIKRDKRDDLFAATPPLEALKMVLTLAVTKILRRKWAKRKIEVIDIKRAFFHAQSKRGCM